MTFITGEQLRLPKTPSIPRSMLRELMDYLNHDSPNNARVCTLYGLRRTGKTTLILQAIRKLLEQGVPADRIGLFTGLRGDSFDELYLELEARPRLRYVFVDEIGFFSGLLQNGSYLYDTLVRLRGQKVVIAGTNLLALYVAEKQTLYDRCHVIRVPFLSFYEHCKFVLGTDAPLTHELMAYLETGGLFHEPEDIPDYVQTSITDSIVELFDTQPESSIFTWLKPQSEEVDWRGYVNTILFLSSNYVSNRSFQNPVSLIQDFEVLDEGITRQIAREFRTYFSMSRQERSFRMKRTETVALLDFLVHCGVITVLPNIFADAEPYKCYVRTPFLRFHFTEKLRQLAGAQIVNERKPLFGDLLEAEMISEYARSHPDSSLGFARTHFPPGSDTVQEIDLVDETARKCYEIKLTDGQGYTGFSLIEAMPELHGFDSMLAGARDCVGLLYEWGSSAYKIK